MKKLLLLLLLAGVAAVIVWGVLRKSEPPKVTFARVKRQTLVSTLPTNGKVEPFEWQPVRAETAGVVSRVAVEEGQVVAAGAVMAAISDPPCRPKSKPPRPRSPKRTPISRPKPAASPPTSPRSKTIWRARVSISQQAQKTVASLERLVAKHAATQQEVDTAREKVQQIELEIAGLRQAPRLAGSPTRVRPPARAWATPRRRSPSRGSAPRSPRSARRWPAWSTGARSARAPT